jgi:hypothetical protein
MRLRRHRSFFPSIFPSCPSTMKHVERYRKDAVNFATNRTSTSLGRKELIKSTDWRVVSTYTDDLSLLRILFKGCSKHLVFFNPRWIAHKFSVDLKTLLVITRDVNTRCRILSCQPCFSRLQQPVLVFLSQVATGSTPRWVFKGWYDLGAAAESQLCLSSLDFHLANLKYGTDCHWWGHYGQNVLCLYRSSVCLTSFVRTGPLVRDASGFSTELFVEHHLIYSSSDVWSAVSYMESWSCSFVHSLLSCSLLSLLTELLV